MVVGRRERDHLAQSQLRQHARVGRLETGRIAERTHSDDGALARHEPWHRLHRAERAWIGQRHRGPGEVVRRDLSGVDFADEVLVGQNERTEVERVRVLDARDEQRARPVLLFLVDGESKADVLVMDDAGLARSVGVGHEGGVERGHVVQRTHDGVADDVGEADLGPGGTGQLVVEDEPVDLEQASGHRAHARRRGHAQAGLHVGDDARRRSAQDGGLLASRSTHRDRGRSGGGGGRGRCGGRRRHAGSARSIGTGNRPVGRGRLTLGDGNRRRPIVGEELAPALADRVRIGQEAVVHVVDQPRIGAKRATCAAELGHGPTLPVEVGVGGQSG